jgi:hypothetical protein
MSSSVFDNGTDGRCNGGADFSFCIPNKTTKQRLFACVNCNTNNVPNWLLFVGMQCIACAKMPFGLCAICF